MPVNTHVSAGESFTFDGPVRSISVHDGKVTVIKGADVAVVGPDETYDAKDTAGLRVTGVDGCRVNVVYSDDPATETPAPAPKSKK